MSLQGQGAGISGTSNQFQVGYSQGAGYGYGNAAGYAPQAGYANQSSAAVQTLQLTSTQGNSNWGWQGQQSNPSHLWGSNQGTVNTVFNPAALQVSYAGYSGSAGNINAYAPSAGYAGSGPNANGGVPQAGYANQAANTAQLLQIQGTGDMTWYWQGQGGTPNHYWGSNDGYNHYVWQANQGYAGYSGSAANANGSGPSAGYASFALYSYQYNFINSAGQAGYAATTQGLQGSYGHPRAWRGNWNGAAGGISQYQGGSYGYVHIEFATNCQAGACGYSIASANFSAFGNNLQTNQVGPGVIMWN